jgi:60 kDa SS-A/Ro ribonucleoprotein
MCGCGLWLRPEELRGYGRLIVMTDGLSHDQPSGVGRTRLGDHLASSRNGAGYEPWTGFDGPSERAINFLAERD